MNIRIDDDVPLPEPDKPSTWVTSPPGPITEVGLASDWMTGGTVERTTFDPPLMIRSTDPELDAALTKDAAYIEAMGGDSGPVLNDVWPQAKMMPSMLKPAVVVHSTRYPAEPTHDAKGAQTTDCFLVGGPLNGQHGPIVGSAKVVELDVYAADGSVSSIQLYELGDRGDLGARYWKGSKPA